MEKKPKTENKPKMGEMMGELEQPSIPRLTLSQQFQKITSDKTFRKTAKFATIGVLSLAAIFSLLKYSPNIISDFNYLVGSQKLSSYENRFAQVRNYVLLEDYASADSMITTLEMEMKEEASPEINSLLETIVAYDKQEIDPILQSTSTQQAAYLFQTQTQQAIELSDLVTQQAINLSQTETQQALESYLTQTEQAKPTPTITPSPTITPTPPQIATSTSTKSTSPYLLLALIDYSEFSSATSSLGLPTGMQNLQSIPFLIGYGLKTPCSNNPNSPAEYSIDMHSDNKIDYGHIDKLHFLIQGGWVTTAYQGKEIGEIVLSFSNGTSYTTSLVAGKNIRDWSIGKPNTVTTITDPSVQEGWTGHDANGDGRMDILTIDLPQEYSNSTLTNIKIEDTSATAFGSINPCIYINAITVEKNP